MNASTAIRHHWLEMFIRIPAVMIPMAIAFKLDPFPTGALGALFTTWGYFIHANLRLQMGSLSPLIGGPQVHRIHHSRLGEHRDKNFAAFFPVWDILFGTYYHPKRDEFPATGIEGERLATATRASFLPFVELFRRSSSRQGFQRCPADS